MLCKTRLRSSLTGHHLPDSRTVSGDAVRIRTLTERSSIQPTIGSEFGFAYRTSYQAEPGSTPSTEGYVAGRWRRRRRILVTAAIVGWSA